jgi:hypothetical protein
LDTTSEKNLYQVAYPNMAENNGFGSTGAAISLPEKHLGELSPLEIL